MKTIGSLQDKKILITGAISRCSIAYGIAKTCRDQGADLAFTYVVDKLEERVRKMMAELDSELAFHCDTTSGDEVNQTFIGLDKHWDGLGGLVHSISSALKEALSGDFPDSISRGTSNTTHEISAYSLSVLAKATRPMMQDHNDSIVTLTCLGAMRTIPNYNVMGMAKASLEVGIRLIAVYLSREGIRRNGIPAGPIKTLAASGIADFDELLGRAAQQSPLGRNVTIEEVGNVATFLLSDLSSGIIGEIIYVDGGCNINALSIEEQTVSTVTKAV